MKDGLVHLGAFSAAVTAGARALIESRRTAIEAGTFKPFSAPLIDNQGNTRLAQGSLDDARIAAMDWLVQGVVGTLP